jgi:aromatic-L-amino-acid decarboxylase
VHDHLESNGDDLSGLLEQVSLGLSAFIDGLDYEPVDGRDQAREIVELIAERPGEGPGDFGKLTTWALQAAGAAVETAGPRFFGYVPGGGLISSAVGELMALVLNRFTGIGEMAPGLVALEHGVLDWLGSLFEMPPGATGILTTGGSQAMISMIVAAREHHLRQTDLSRARMYLSDQTHHSIAKAAHICGFPSGSIHVIPTAAGGKLDPAPSPRRSPTTGRPGTSRSSSSERPVRPIWGWSNRSPSWQALPGTTVSGSTWMAATAGSSS